MDLDDETLAYAQRMFDLARAGATAELAAQVDGGLPVNLTNSRGDTLLILAAYYKRTATVAALVARGADLNRANDRGQTALAAAAFRADREAVELLLAAGADCRAGGPDAIETARFFGNTEVLALLEP